MLKNFSKSCGHNFIFYFIYLFSFLLTINLKLIIVHVETKIVNKEAATKRSTLTTLLQYTLWSPYL